MSAPVHHLQRPDTGRMGRRKPNLTVVPLDREHSVRPDDEWTGLLCAVGARQDRDAFARLFAHFAPRVKRHLMLGGSPESQAEDLAQETMVIVWRKAALFNPDQAAVSTWIFTIARNLRVDLLRRRQGIEAHDEMLDADTFEAAGPAAEDRLHAVRQDERLRGALGQLPPGQRQVLHLSYFDDEPHSRIAAELGIPLGTVKSRIRLAVAQLRRLMER